jgi:hypothetical protein
MDDSQLKRSFLDLLGEAKTDAYGNCQVSPLAWEMFKADLDLYIDNRIRGALHAATRDTQAGAAPNPAIGGSVGSQSDSSNG